MEHPFHFNCHRCGNCCRVGHGHVWIDAQDVDAMAEEKQMTSAAFLQRFVYGKDGRLALREEPNGACALLDSDNSCSIYECRPQQCSDFPYWPQLAVTGDALDMASAYCPGIQRFPSVELAQVVLPQVAELVAKYGAHAAVDDDAAQQGERWGTSLEIDLFLSSGVELCNVVWPHSQQLRSDLEEIAASSGYPYSVSPWARLLSDRKSGWHELGGVPKI